MDKSIYLALRKIAADDITKQQLHDALFPKLDLVGPYTDEYKKKAQHAGALMGQGLAIPIGMHASDWLAENYYPRLKNAQAVANRWAHLAAITSGAAPAVVETLGHKLNSTDLSGDKVLDIADTGLGALESGKEAVKGVVGAATDVGKEFYEEQVEPHVPRAKELWGRAKNLFGTW